MKAVLPAAGFGTRFLPVSKAVPKELLPLGSKPVIQYVVEEAVAAGCDEILVILSRGKEIIRKYFEPSPDLESVLERGGRTRELEGLRAVSSLACFHFVYQPEMKGLGDAVLQAREFCGDSPFAVLLADTVIHGPSPLADMWASWSANRTSCVALEPCPAERVSRYGIAGGRETGPGHFHIESMVEKPAAGKVPVMRGSDGRDLPPHAFAARYVFTPAIFAALEKAVPTLNGEIQLTDAMAAVLEREGFRGVRMAGRRLDIGNPRGLLEAFPLFVEG